MNILKRELKANFKSLIIWSVCFALLVVTGMMKFSTALADPKAFSEVISQIPTFLKSLFGLGNFDLSTLIGYYGVITYYLILLAGIHACFISAHIISKEEQEKTTEFLLVKPISRSKIIFAKLCAVLVNILIVNIVSTITSISVIASMNKGADLFATIILMMIDMFAVQLIFMFVGSAIATLSHKPKLAANRATIILLATFFIGWFIDLLGNVEFLKYLTPFKYFNPIDIINNKPIDGYMVFLTLFISTVFFVLTFVGYKGRDLNV